MFFERGTDSRGQGLAEYIIVVLLVGIVVLVSVRLFGKSVSCQFENAAGQISVGESNPCVTVAAQQPPAPEPPPPPLPPLPPPPPPPLPAPPPPPEPASPEPQPPVNPPPPTPLPTPLPSPAASPAETPTPGPSPQKGICYDNYTYSKNCEWLGPFCGQPSNSVSTTCTPLFTVVTQGVQQINDANNFCYKIKDKDACNAARPPSLSGTIFPCSQLDCGK